MARPWGIACEQTYDCVHCGARYAVRFVRSPRRDHNGVRCEVCLHQMSDWSPTARPSYTLIERPGPYD